jgi:hypothetical protein
VTILAVRRRAAMCTLAPMSLSRVVSIARARLAPVLTSVLLSACGGDKAASAPPPTPAPAPSVPAALPTVTLPDSACHLTSKRPFDQVRLRTTIDGKPFATVGNMRLAMGSLGGDAGAAAPSPDLSDVVVPDGASVGVVGVRAQTSAFVVRGFADPADVPIHPTHVAVSGGFLIATRVRLTSAKGGRATVVPATGARVELLAAPPPQEVACAELSLDEPDDPRAVSPQPTAGDVVKYFIDTAPVELAVEPGGPAVARLHPDPAVNDPVYVLEARGKATRILWYVDDALVFGWVPSAAIVPPSLARNIEGKMGTSTKRGGPALRCDHDVALIADVGGPHGRTIVGAILGKARIEVAERTGGAARITVPRSDFTPADGVTFWVDERELAGCPAAPDVHEDGPLADFKNLGTIGTHSTIGDAPGLGAPAKPVKPARPK